MLSTQISAAHGVTIERVTPGAGKPFYAVRRGRMCRTFVRKANADRTYRQWVKEAQSQEPASIEVLVLPGCDALDWVPVPGDYVANFGQVALVLSQCPERGLLVRCTATGQKWYADPAKCQPVR